MNAIISNGNYTARVQLPVERRQLAGALSYLHANHASAYDIKYNEESDQGLTFTLECHGIVENAIAKALPTGFRFHTLNDTIALMYNLPYTSKAHIYAYFDGRNESEIIVDPKYLMDITEAEMMDNAFDISM